MNQNVAGVFHFWLQSTNKYQRKITLRQCANTPEYKWALMDWQFLPVLFPFPVRAYKQVT